jgi:signal peptidase I
MTDAALVQSTVYARGVGRRMGLAFAGIMFGILAGTLVVAITATRLLGFGALTVTSGSMSPAIAPGDLIVVKPVAISSVRVGDVVLFERGRDSIPTVHRVVAINEIEIRITDGEGGRVKESYTEHRLVTQGDANPASDSGEVTADELRGVIWFTIPLAGTLADYPMQWLFMVLAMAAGIGWAAWELSMRARRKREQEDAA